MKKWASEAGSVDRFGVTKGATPWLSRRACSCLRRAGDEVKFVAYDYRINVQCSKAGQHECCGKPLPVELSRHLSRTLYDPERCQFGRQLLEAHLSPFHLVPDQGISPLFPDRRVSRHQRCFVIHSHSRQRMLRPVRRDQNLFSVEYDRIALNRTASFLHPTKRNFSVTWE